MTLLKPSNVYRMLCYAFHVLNEKTYEDAAVEEFENIHNLFAEIINLGVRKQIKRGLTYEYEYLSDTMTTLRGKVQINKSFEGLSGFSNKLTCSFDEFTLNNPMNQVLKTTMLILIKSGDVTKERKENLRFLMDYFRNVELVNPHCIDWSAFKYHRNNATYKMLMNICYLVLSGLLITDEKGNYKLMKFIDDQKMNELYEKFILEYYRKHYPEFRADNEGIVWKIKNSEYNSGLDFLPGMLTDITLHYNSHVLIIDAKYYNNSMAKTPYSEGMKYKSQNLYQIFTYVNNYNKTDSRNVDGMLLYAKTDEVDQENLHFETPNGNRFAIRTLDLSGDWENIRFTLNSIADEFIKRSCRSTVSSTCPE